MSQGRELGMGLLICFEPCIYSNWRELSNVELAHLFHLLLFMFK